MPCIGFECRRSPVTSFDECIGKCTNRCISRRTASVFREFSKPRNLENFSITELVGPTRQQCLMKMFNFYEKPDSFVARSVGLMGHSMTDIDVDGALSEERMDLPGEDITVTGKFDSMEKGDELWDLKITGGYKIKKGLEDVLYLHDWIIQQNFYRMMVKHNLDIDIKHMYIEAWAKEPQGMCKRMGINQITIFELPFISDWLINKYLAIKHKALIDALDGHIPECRPRELWGGRRCNYCSVSTECKECREIKEKNAKLE